MKKISHYSFKSKLGYHSQKILVTLLVNFFKYIILSFISNIYEPVSIRPQALLFIYIIQ